MEPSTEPFRDCFLDCIGEDAYILRNHLMHPIMGPETRSIMAQWLEMHGVKMPDGDISEPVKIRLKQPQGIF